MRKRIKNISEIVMLILCVAIMLCPSAIAVLEYEVYNNDDGIGIDNNERIIFDQDQDEIEILGAAVGIGDTSPDFKLEVTGSSGSGYFGVTSSSSRDLDILGILALFF
jgi:hypothetical protein